MGVSIMGRLRGSLALATDADYRGPKAPAKPGKAPPTLPPRLQHPPGLRQRAPPGHSAAPQSQKPSSEHRSLSRTPTQAAR